MNTQNTIGNREVLIESSLTFDPEFEYLEGMNARREALIGECKTFKSVMATEAGRERVDRLFHENSHHELIIDDKNPHSRKWFRKPGFSNRVAYFAMDSKEPHMFALLRKANHKPRGVYMYLLDKLRTYHDCHFDTILNLRQGNLPQAEHFMRLHTNLPLRIYRGKTVDWCDTFEFPLVHFQKAEKLDQVSLKSMEEAIIRYCIGIPYHPDHSDMWR